MAVPEIPVDQQCVDAELVDRLRAGDRSAFDAIYERYFKRIYRFVDRRISIRADVEETTQEVFINVFSSIESFRGDAPFSAWVFGITRRVIAARFKRKRHPTIPLDIEETDRLAGSLASCGTSPTPLESYECNERIARMTETIERRLSDEQRRLFEMHHLEERSISEIAVTLERSEDAIKSNLYRTRKLLLAR